jgi:hypothetical protein
MPGAPLNGNEEVGEESGNDEIGIVADADWSIAPFKPKRS